MVIIETERLFIQDWQLEDWIDFRHIATDPDVMRYIGDGKTWDDERIKTWVQKQIDNDQSLGFCMWKLVDKTSKRLVGHCGIQYLAHTGEVEIGWWLARDLWGKGLATEAARKVLQAAFDRFQLSRIIAIAYPENIASINIMQKLGMAFEKMTTGKALGLGHSDIQIVLYSITKK